MVTRIVSIGLFVVSLVLAFILYNSISSSIEFKEYVEDTETQIKDKLAIIREAEKAFLDQYGHYTANWDSLKQFIQNGRVPITVRTETITQLSYGEEKVDVKIDTVGFQPARDRIFKKTHVVNASTTGIFLGFLVKEGDHVEKRTNAYRMRVGNQNDIVRFTDAGTVTELADITPGTQITAGQNLATISSYQLNPNVDISTLEIVPGSNKQFDIFVGKIDRNGLPVSVIEVRDPAPINPERKASNEAKNRQPLGFGSRTDVGTTGNWE